MVLIATMTLNDWMVANRKSRDDVARLIGVSVVSVGRYLTGERIPKTKILMKIKHITGNQVTADSFLSSTKMGKKMAA